MLVGPGTSPGKVVMMRNAGAGTPLNNAVFIFRDNANSSLPSTGPIASGFYKPTDLGSGAFPTAGSPTASTFASGFSTPPIDPNGTWSLFVIDDTTNNTHGAQISGGWQLEIHTTPKITPIPDQITAEDTPVRVGVTIGDNQPGADIVLTATSGDTTLVSNTNLEFSGTGATRTLRVTPNTHKA